MLRNMSTWSSIEPLRGDAQVRGREPVVPDQRHALDRRRRRPHHAVEPGQVVVADRVGRRERAVALVLRLRPDELVRHGPRHRVDRVLEPELDELVRLAGTCAEPGPPEEPFRLGPAERPAVDRNRHAPIRRRWSEWSQPRSGKARRGTTPPESVYHPRTEGRRERVGYAAHAGRGKGGTRRRARGQRAHAGRARADRAGGSRARRARHHVAGERRHRPFGLGRARGRAQARDAEDAEEAGSRARRHQGDLLRARREQAHLRPVHGEVHRRRSTSSRARSRPRRR